MHPRTQGAYGPPPHRCGVLPTPAWPQHADLVDTVTGCMERVVLAATGAQAQGWHQALCDAGRWQVRPMVSTLADTRRLLQAQPPALLVAGLRLADGSLADLVRTLRHSGRLGRLPVLAVSANEHEPLMLDAMLAGVDSFHIDEAPRGKGLAARALDALAGGADIAPWTARRLLSLLGELGGEPAPRQRSVADLSNPLSPSPAELALLKELAFGMSLADLARRRQHSARELAEQVRGVGLKLQWALSAGDLSLA